MNKVRGQIQVWIQVYLTPNFMLLPTIPEGPKIYRKLYCRLWLLFLPMLLEVGM